MQGINVRNDSNVRRRVMLGVYTLLLLAIAPTVLIVVLDWSFSKYDDRIPVIAPTDKALRRAGSLGGPRPSPRSTAVASKVSARFAEST
jgi:hypothetical protein